VVALSLSVAGYEGEVMRGAFKGVPHGQLEAAKAMGMPPFTLLRRIWLPQALQRVLPTLGGETVSQLKSTPLVSTITIMANQAGSVHEVLTSAVEYICRFTGWPAAHAYLVSGDGADRRMRATGIWYCDPDHDLYLRIHLSFGRPQTREREGRPRTV
jgi:ABC-type arginine/histidine transport system permease subunit